MWFLGYTYLKGHVVYLEKIQLNLRRNLWNLLTLFLCHMLMICYYQLHWSLKLRFLGDTPRDSMVLLFFFGLRALAESSSSKSDCFFAVIDFCASYFTYSFNSLSIWSLVFLNYLNSLFFSLSFWTTSTLNQFWVFWLLPLIRLVLQTATWSMTVISF